MDQFIVFAVTSWLGGQKEKKRPMMVKRMEIMLIGSPKRPSLNGPHRIESADSVSRFRSNIEADRRKDE